jgi:phage baseplate assembly protein W
MAIEHILTDNDTVQSLAYRYLGSASDWLQIVDYNGLEYPYTLTSDDAKASLHASGYVKVTRDLFSSALTVYKGSLFATKIDNQGIQRLYEVPEDTVIPAGEPSGYIFVRCTTFGTFGNVIAHAINQPYRVNTNLGQSISSLIVDNETSFTNGTDSTVKVTGQPIYIPIASEDEDMQVITNVNSFLNLLGGEDLALDKDGDLMEDGMGDLGSWLGLDNIKQALTHRLMTERGSLSHHPEYGTRLAELIGKTGAPYILKLMELDIHESLAYEDRLSGVVVNAVEQEGTAIYVDLTVEINRVGENFRLQLNF